MIKISYWFSSYSRKCRGCFFGTQCICHIAEFVPSSSLTSVSFTKTVCVFLKLSAKVSWQLACQLLSANFHQSRSIVFLNYREHKMNFRVQFVYFCLSNAMMMMMMKDELTLAWR